MTDGIESRHLRGMMQRNALSRQARLAERNAVPRVGRTRVLCSCGADRWYGFGACSVCGAPGTAVISPELPQD